MNNYHEQYYSEKEIEYYTQSRRDVIDFLPRNIENLLDVGCSNGDFGYEIKRLRNIEVFGVEPNFNSAQIANKKLDKVYNGLFNDKIMFDSVKFHCITFNDVLEHMEDPWEALKLAKNILLEDGVIAASIPNIQCYSVLKEIVLEQDFEYKKSGILDKTHLRFFTKKSIIRMFELSGFDVLKIEGIGSVENSSRLFKILSFLPKKYFANFLYSGFLILAEPKKKSNR